MKKDLENKVEELEDEVDELNIKMDTLQQVQFRLPPSDQSAQTLIPNMPDVLQHTLTLVVHQRVLYLFLFSQRHV